MISGILFSSFLQLYSQLQEKQRIETTKTRMEALRVALTDYVVTHDRLPCPASPAGLPASANNDDPCAPDAKPPQGVIAATIGKHVMGGNRELEVWIGVVPTRELRLGGDMRRDGWGNDFTYAVSRRLTFPKGMVGNPVPTGIISVVDENGNSVLDKPDTGRYVIISHGPTGDGGWTAQGVRTACPAGTLAGANCKDNGVFVAAPFSRAPGPAYYDHFLIYDGPDAGGSLISRIAACNLKKAFYIPTAAGADEEGCFRDIGLWHGACLQSTKYDKSGNPQPQPAVALMPPAAAAGTNCVCQSNYQPVRINSWAATFDHVVVVSMDTACLALTADKNGKITGTVTSPTAPSANTALYTCVQ